MDTPVAYSPEIERYVIGACIIQDNKAEVASLVDRDDFFKPAHGIIITHAKKLLLLRGKCDLVILADSLERANVLPQCGGAEYLVECCEYSLAGNEWRECVRILKDMRKMRDADQIARNLVQSLRGPDRDTALRAALEESEQLHRLFNSNKSSDEIPSVLASQIEPARTEFLMYPWVPKNAMSLFDASPGVGKTTLAAHLLAKFSAGEALPGREGGVPLKCWVILFEDSPSAKWVPALYREGANMDNVRISRHWMGSLSAEGIADMRHYVRKHSIDVVWVDPLMSMLARTLGDGAHYMSSRAPMDNLSAMLEGEGVTLLAARHLSSEGEKELRRNKGRPIAGGGGYGPIDLRASARSVMSLVAGDELDGGRAKVVTMYHSKYNNSSGSAPASFSIARSNITGMPIVKWLNVPEAPPMPTLREILEKILEQGTRRVNYVLSITRGAGFPDSAVCAEAEQMGLVTGVDESDGLATWSEEPDPFAE